MPEIKQFMEKKKKNVEFIEYEEWLNDFSFLVDITEILANLNLHLQGKDQLCISMFDRITSFTKKLELFIAQQKAGEILHFRSLSERVQNSSVNYELPSREGLKTFHREHTLPLIHRKLHSFNEFNEIVNLSRKLLCMWGSTYCCEQFFSCMKNIKTAERNRLTDKHLANILRIKTTSINANLDNIVAGKQSKKSH